MSEQLTVGWEPELAVADTFLRQAVFAFGNASATVVGAAGGDVWRDGQVIASDLGRPATFFNLAVLTQPLQFEGVSTLLRRIEDFYTGSGKQGMVVLASAWPTPDLASRGWQLMGHPPLHLRPAGGSAPESPPGVRIETVTTMDGLYAWERCGVEGYPLDEVLPWRRGCIVSEGVLADDRHRMYIAWLGDEVVGASATFVEYGVNYVSLVATRAEARGRGIGSALTWQATLVDPTLPALLLSSDKGRPVYEKMGYLALQRFSLWYRLR